MVFICHTVDNTIKPLRRVDVANNNFVVYSVYDG